MIYQFVYNIAISDTKYSNINTTTNVTFLLPIAPIPSPVYNLPPSGTNLLHTVCYNSKVNGIIKT